MKKIGIIATALVVVIAAGAAGWWFHQKSGRPVIVDIDNLPAFCRPTDFEGARYITCEIDLRRYDAGVFLNDAMGKSYGSLAAFDAAMGAAVTRPLLAMNAGMYHDDLKPVGLLVQDGVEVAPVETSDGEGNFYLKPNGIFFIDEAGKAGLLTTEKYGLAQPKPKHATQSGPMLVIDGGIHPKFEPNGESRYVRNGVGVRDADAIMLAVSLDKVSLGSFARFFRDASLCPNALFFDGQVSALSNGTTMLLGGDYPTGPIIAVFDKGTR